MSSRASRSWETYAKELGIELQRRRAAAGLTQEDLAHRAGLTRTHYQQIEKGYWSKGRPSNPSLKLLARLAIVLDLEVADIAPTVKALEID